MISKEAEPLEFSIPKETSWHFERKLKPDDKTVDNYVLIQPGAADVVKVLKAYSHHAVPAYNIVSIEILYNEALNRQFSGHIRLMNGRKGNPKYIPSWRKTATGAEKAWREETYRQLQGLSEGHGDPNVPNIMLLPLWHGTSDEVSNYIFSGGYGIFTSNDPKFVTDDGYFGKGIYTAHEAEYAFRSYAKKHGDKGVLLLNWVSIFEGYPVIDGDMPKLQGKMGGYDQCDAHFVPVCSEHHPHTYSYFPCAPHQVQNYHEIVVFTYQQCLPRYRVKLIQNTPLPVIDDTASLCYQSALDSWGLGQYTIVANAFNDAASAGHPGASVRLHWLYSGANGVIPGNHQELQNYQTLPTSSFNELKRKANFRGENDQESQFTLAWCYQHGLGCEVNLVKAAQYYWIAAVQGHRDAQYQLGACCAAGMGVKPDMKQAMVYYAQAAAQGHVHAHYVLSQCYECGLGIQANPAQALIHKQAAQKGKHPQLMGVGLPPISSVIPSPVIISPNVQLEQENKQLKSQLTQQESRFKEQLKQQKDISDQAKRKIDELTQAVSAEKHASRSKDEMLARQQQEVAKKEAELRDKNAKLEEKDQFLQHQTQSLQNQTQKATSLSRELQFTQNELGKKEETLKMQFSEMEKLTMRISQLEQALGESKERESRIKMEFQAYQKPPQSPAPQLQPTGQTSPFFPYSNSNPFQPQTGYGSPFFPANPSPTKPVLLNAQQQEKQNQLVAACLKGDIGLVKQLELQGVSLLYPNQEGLYPLVAAVYGCSLELVRYVELKLKDEAGKQWLQVDANKALEHLNRWTPTALSSKATYGELGNWYVKYNGASWCGYYDSECLKRHTYYKNWGGWDGSYKDIVWSDAKALWGKEGCRARWHEKAERTMTGMEAWWGGIIERYKEGLISPRVEIHDDVVKTIREQLNELRNDVETKVKRSSAAVFKV